MNIDDWQPAIITLLGCTGAWGVVKLRVQHRHEIKLKERDSSGEFKESLQERAKVLSAENKELHTKVDELQAMLMQVSIELAASKEKIKHLEADVAEYEMRLKANLT